MLDTIRLKRFKKHGWQQSRKFIFISPTIVPASFVVFSIFCMTLLLVGEFTSLNVAVCAVLSLVVIYTLFRSSSLESKLTREDKGCLAALVIFLILWTGFNINYTAQNIFVYRDPALYNNSAAWLVEHDSLEIYASDVFGEDPSIQGSAISLKNIEGEGRQLFVHGGQLLPALMSLAGRIAGMSAVFKANIIIAALGLFAFYGFGCTLLKSRWALVGTIALSLLLPMIYFARDSYTEPLALLMVFAALSLTSTAIKQHKAGYWLLAGLAAGASSFTRIDAYLLVASFILFAGAYLAFSKRTKSEYLQIMSFIIGLALTSLLGWFLFTELGAAYYNDLNKFFIQQVILIIATVVFSVLLVAFCHHKALPQKLRATRIFKNLPTITVVLFASALLLISSRPLWLTSYGTEQNPVVEGLQRAEGVMVEPRMYTEESLNWLWWYTGPFFLLVGIIGFLWVLHKLTKNYYAAYEDYLPFILVFSITTFVYLIRPSITPDQIWAVRRFLPIVFPGFVLLAFIVVQQTHQRLAKLRLSVRGLTVLLVSFFAPILFITQPFLRTKTYQNQLSHVYEICHSLPADAAVLLVGINGQNMLQALRTYCDVPAEWVHEPTQKILREAHMQAVKNDRTPVVLVNNSDLLVLPSSSRLSTVVAAEYNDLGRNLFHPPRSTTSNPTILLAGELTNNGEVQSLD